MLVRCGRCKVELEVSGPGEFLCPRCGTKNAVRGAPASGLGFDPYDIAGAAGGFAAPGAPPSPFAPVPHAGGAPPISDQEPQGIRWIRCPACAYRFAVGEVAEVGCPSCTTKLEVGEEDVRIAADA